MKNTASSKRPGPVAWPDWYLPYSRTPAMAPTTAIARNVNPVTSSQSWRSTRAKETAVARSAAKAARPIRLRSITLTAAWKSSLIFLKVWPSIIIPATPLPHCVTTVDFSSGRGYNDDG
ncbi:MAG: hypothetical protein WBQ43_24250 [Terriglobales bacterium]